MYVSEQTSEEERKKQIEKEEREISSSPVSDCTCF
jgi:hypothetical protein